jgi:hypothetical protein
MAKYSRSAEKEADALGTRIMMRAGYDPVSMAQFFDKLAAEGGSRPPVFLSSHPDPGNRVENVRAEMAALPAGDYGYQTGQFPQAKRQVAQLPPPKKTMQQTATANQPPSAPTGAFQTVRGQTFSVDYPTGWESFGDQRSQTLTLAPRNGLVQTQGGGVGIGYGAVLAYYQPQQARNLRDASLELASELRAMNPRMKLSANPRPTQVQGNPAFVLVLDSQSPFGGVERDVLLTVSRPQGVFYMVFIAPDQNFDQFQPAFQRMVDSIRFGG